MDIISHGLWGGITVGRKSGRSFWTAFCFGVAPDLFAFGPMFANRMFIHGLDFLRTGFKNGFKHVAGSASI